jgi:hypothetical protein
MTWRGRAGDAVSATPNDVSGVASFDRFTVGLFGMQSSVGEHIVSIDEDRIIRDRSEKLAAPFDRKFSIDS